MSRDVGAPAQGVSRHFEVVKLTQDALEAKARELQEQRAREEAEKEAERKRRLAQYAHLEGTSVSFDDRGDRYNLSPDVVSSLAQKYRGLTTLDILKAVMNIDPHPRWNASEILERVEAQLARAARRLAGNEGVYPYFQSQKYA